MKVTVGLSLTGDKYLGDTIPTLMDQDYPDIEYIFWDSEDGIWRAYNFIEKNLPDVLKKVKFTKGQNLWHSGNNNKMIEMMTGDLYICASNDMLYPRDFVSKVVKAFKENPDYDFGTVKSMRWDYENGKKKTNIIDSFGIAIDEYHHFYDIGQTEEDQGQYDNLKDVFGVSGAMFIITKKGLNSIKFEDQYFDNLLHYKNDVDLSYRLKWAGNKGFLIQDVCVYHDRQVAKKKNSTASMGLDVLKNQSKSKRSLFMKESSFWGDLILMNKNFSKDFPLSIKIKSRIYHFLKNGFRLITTPVLFKKLQSYFKILPEVEKRKKAMKREAPVSEILRFMKPLKNGKYE